ncbi:hypothetical protein KIW84_073163 [Lathyrus oleraceus]|uniref:Uncharacterized protein n=1 Tax=Pisum sativum TaxID=3888 RepID=A0A9D4VQ56_PEA|nr:hypothetical protein KIW84_073163 [Pisum sativum]
MTTGGSSASTMRSQRGRYSNLFVPLTATRTSVDTTPIQPVRCSSRFMGSLVHAQAPIPVRGSSNSLQNQLKQTMDRTAPSRELRYWLAFPVSVPPIGFSIYIVSRPRQTGHVSTISKEFRSEGNTNNNIEVGQGNLKLLYSANEGKLTHYVNNRNLVTASVEQSYSFYSGNVRDDKDSQASGAYVFRPNGSFPIKSDQRASFTVLRGPILDEVHQQLNPWVSQIVRIYQAKEHAEVEFTIGPIPVDDGIGKEVITQFSTTMKNQQSYAEENEFSSATQSSAANFVPSGSQVQGSSVELLI